ncbi:MAG: hypothetical protein QME12_06115 [Nanoarchaeota archaeon]|nr:hypothetical protein [Nanoarchaeota archaeon]
MDNEKLKQINEKAYELVATLKLNNKGKYDSRSKIKSLREYLPRQPEANEQGILDFVKNANYSLLRGKDTKNFLQALLKIINEIKGYSTADKVVFLGYLIGYVSMTMDSIENLHDVVPHTFKQNISQMLEAEFGEKKDDLAEKVINSAKQPEHKPARRY